jgi:hypothetical protein
MSQINTPRRARKPYRCDNEYPASDAYLYGHPDIKIGDPYMRLALPPGGDLVDNEGWMTARYCQPCADEHGYFGRAS